MPTGYTNSILEGATFEQFVWRCARAFGANVMMRDEGGDAMPREYEPDAYHRDALKEAEAKLADLKSIADDRAEIARRAEAETGRARDAHEEIATKGTVDHDRYTAMLKQVLKWTPPSPDHVELKRFMEKQIRESLDFDCGHVWTPPPVPTPVEWYEDAIKRAAKDVQYHAKKWAEEQDRTRERNTWNATLAGSVPMPKTLEPKERK
jgi:hypothetical protein